MKYYRLLNEEEYIRMGDEMFVEQQWEPVNGGWIHRQNMGYFIVRREIIDFNEGNSKDSKE